MLLCLGSYSDKVFSVGFDEKSFELTLAGEAGGVVNPSYIAIRGKLLYAASEEATAARAACFYLVEGTPLFLSAVEHLGCGTCHVSVSPDGRSLYAADYLSGGFWSASLDEEGLISSVTAERIYRGSGSNPERQECQHSHSMTPAPDGNIIVGADLGLDRLFVFDRSLRLLTEVPVTSGYGPRHFAFSPDGRYGYLLCELSCRIIAYEVEGCTLKRICEYPLAGTSAGDTAVAIEVSADGGYLFCSVRGIDRIFCHAIEQTGELRLLGCCDCGGRSPRDIAVSADCRFIFVANQSSDEISVLKTEITGTSFLAKKVTALSVPAVSSVVISNQQ